MVHEMIGEVAARLAAGRWPGLPGPASPGSLRRPTGRTLLLAIVLGSVLGACGGGRSPAEQADDFCTTWMQADLRHQASCWAWSQAYLEQQLADVRANCELYRRSVEAERQAFDPSRAARCLEETAASYAACGGADALMPPVCDEVLAPRVSPGGRCGASGDCVRGSCEFPTGVCAWTGLGTCVAWGSSGDECKSITLIFESSLCPAGERCSFGESHYACVATLEVGAGEPCDDYPERTCRAGYYCPAPLLGGVPTNPTCQPVRSLGEPCTYPRGWPSPECAAGLVCGSGLVCAQPVGQGASCSAASTECGSGLFCDQGVCASLPDLGDSCAVARRCLRGSCSTADLRCHPLAGAGEVCRTYSDCESGLCTGGTCEAEPCPSPYSLRASRAAPVARQVLAPLTAPGTAPSPPADRAATAGPRPRR